MDEDGVSDDDDDDDDENMDSCTSDNNGDKEEEEDGKCFYVFCKNFSNLQVYSQFSNKMYTVSQKHWTPVTFSNNSNKRGHLLLIQVIFGKNLHLITHTFLQNLIKTGNQLEL